MGNRNREHRDFGDRQALYAFIEKVKSEHPTIDILVNNASTILRNPAAEHPDEMWDEVIEINLNAQFVLSREIVREMLARGRGKIHLHCLAADLPGRHQCAGLRGEQRWHRPAHDGALE